MIYHTKEDQINTYGTMGPQHPIIYERTSSTAVSGRVWVSVFLSLLFLRTPASSRWRNLEAVLIAVLPSYMVRYVEPA